jgi:hypothetical protein
MEAVFMEDKTMRDVDIRGESVRRHTRRLAKMDNYARYIVGGDRDITEARERANADFYARYADLIINPEEGFHFRPPKPAMDTVDSPDTVEHETYVTKKANSAAMNKKQTVILWIGGMISAIILLDMGFDRRLHSSEFIEGLCVIAAVWIVSLLFFYTLRNKGEKLHIEKALPIVIFALLVGGYVLGYGSLAISDLSFKITSAASSCSNAEDYCMDCIR